MSTFFEDLQRRKVYRVAVAYAVAAGGIIQLASAVFPAWDLPSWALRLVVVLLLAGFPIALVLAWAFDVTPAGIQATEEALSKIGDLKVISRKFIPIWDPLRDNPRFLKLLKKYNGPA